MFKFIENNSHFINEHIGYFLLCSALFSGSLMCFKHLDLIHWLPGLITGCVLMLSSTILFLFNVNKGQLFSEKNNIKRGTMKFWTIGFIYINVVSNITFVLFFQIMERI